MRTLAKINYGSLMLLGSLYVCGCDGGGTTTSHTGILEVCNGIDDDGDHEIDEGNPGGGAECFVGNSGTCGVSIERCENGTIVCPPNEEICNDIDDDCDGEVDEGFKLYPYYRDDDGDGVGTDESVEACEKPNGYAEQHGDCDDNNPNVYPSAVEVCNDADDNCNGYPDESVQKPIFYKDVDGDGFGGVTMTFACEQHMGFVLEGGDCNDSNNDVFPGASEQCDDIDNDCNGIVDDGVPTHTIYKDNDGDGVAPLGALSQEKCNVPIGWTDAVDVDGDGSLDWDCNDSDFTVHPGAATVCDGKDNDCDGVVDRLCFSECEGNWPYQLQGAQYRVTNVSHVDLDGDGYHEAIFQTSQGFAILSHDGKPLHSISTNNLNYSRAVPSVADLDTFDTYGPAVQSLELLTVNASKPTYYFLNANQSVTVVPSSLTSYDASRLIASDIDRDGIVELFTSSWCDPAQGTRIFRYDRTTKTIKLAKDIADPDGTCEYDDGRILTDLDGDGEAEYIFGNGYASNSTPEVWKGRIYAQKFTNRTTLDNNPYCNSGTCFNTTIPNLYGGGVRDFLRIGNELEVRVNYFEQNVAGSPMQSRYWTFGLNGMPGQGSPSSDSTVFRYPTDIDNDGILESVPAVAEMGLYDVNGDGFPDQLTSSGTDLQAKLWDPLSKTFAINPGSSKSISATETKVWTAWDMDGDGRLEVLSTDANQKLYCHKLGGETWNKADNLPPHLPLYMRTHQWDNYEPNEGADTNGDGMPDQYIRVPSALTTKGEFYGYLSSPTDKDYYLIDAGHVGPICMTSPKGHSYTLRVYSFEDRKMPLDGRLDGLIVEDKSSKSEKCFHTGQLSPTRHGEYRFVVGIESQGTHSASWPYWISAPK